ncbi:MAG TPA: VanW family protein [Chloroflexota bacterium]|nr:VanW family protein [Chloroflexota bacterium]
MRKTEYVVRANAAPAALDSLRTRFERRRRRQAVTRPWHRRVQALLSRLEALPWRDLSLLPWRAIAAGVGGGLLLLLVLSTLVFQIAYGERIQPGVHALGLDLGGKTRPEAQDVLSERIAAFGREPLTFYFDNREWSTTPAELGVRLEAAPIVAAAYAVGREGNPLDRVTRPVRSLFGGREVPQPQVAMDDARVDAYLATLAAAIDRPMASARLAIDPAGRVNYTPAETERRTDLAATRGRLRDALLVGEDLRVPLVVAERNPPITDDDLAAAREQAERYLAGPVVLELNGDSWKLEPADIAAALEIVGTADRPTGVRLKDTPFEQAVQRIAKTINQPASNARFEFVGGELRPIRESREGREVDVAALLAAVRQAVGSAERTVEVPAKITQPAVTTAQRAQLGVHDLIERGETRYAGSSPPKIHNIKLAASRLHGVVVPPGAMFSFNQELGPTTLDSGYQVGWGIAAVGDGGHATVPSVAGGICQVATTLFQPVFWGGYQIEERHNHLYWIYAYGQPPLGRTGLDATVDEDSGLDFRFINSSPDYVLIQTATDDTTLSISLYGTKPSWSVKVEGPTITNRKSARQEIVRAPEPSLPWGQQLQVESAGDGFDVALTRTVNDGATVRTLNLRTHYEPSQNLIVVGVRGAPPGAAAEIRASNRPAPNVAAGAASSAHAAGSNGSATGASAAAAPSASAQPTLAPTLAPSLGASSGATTSGSQAAAPAPAAPTQAPAPPAAASRSSGQGAAGPSSPASASAPDAPAGGSAASGSASAPAASGPAAAPANPAPSAPAAPAVAPNAPRFGNSAAH